MANLPLTNSDTFATVDDIDYKWASKFQWRQDEDGHIVRDVMDQDGNEDTVYLCNEVICRRMGYPLSSFGPPHGADKAKEKLRQKKKIARRLRKRRSSN